MTFEVEERNAGMPLLLDVAATDPANEAKEINGALWLYAASCIPRTSSGLKFQPETEFRLNGVSGKQTACGLNSIFEQFLPSLDGKTTDT